MSNLKITVVTVTYNAEEYIKRTIESVINQDYKNIEYIIIDGGSTDNTLNIIAQYSNHISYFISEPDNGTYDAMNKAIQRASGTWVNFLNAGDTFVNSNVITTFIKDVDNSKSIICGNINIVNEKNEIITTNYPEIGEDITKHFIANHQAMFTKKDLLERNPFNLHYKYASDFDFCINAGKESSNFQILNFTVANYLIGGIWAQNTISAHIEILNILTRRMKNQYDIFKHRTYKMLSNLDSTKNYNLSINLNKLIKNIEIIFNNNNRIILYGNGNIRKLVTLYGDRKKVIAIYDKNNTNSLDRIPLIELQNINSIQYDCILITVLGREEEIKNTLINDYNIDKNKIIEFNLFS